MYGRLFPLFPHNFRILIANTEARVIWHVLHSEHVISIFSIYSRWLFTSNFSYCYKIFLKFYIKKGKLKLKSSL